MPASPAPTPPAAANPPAVPMELLRGVKVTKTAFTKPKDGDPYWEISVAGTGIARLLVTRDEQLYKEAASFEGVDHMVCLRWRWGKTADKEKVAVMESLTIDDGGQLFN